MSDRDQRTDDAMSDFERRLRDADRSIGVPPALLRRIEVGLAPASAPRHQLRLVTTARVAAAVAVLGAAILVTTTLPTRSPRETQTPVASTEPRSAARPVTVSFEPDSELFARAIPSTRSNITIVRVYRGHPRRDAAGAPEGNES